MLILNFLLCQARELISKLTEERNSVIEQNQKFQQELVLYLFLKFSFKNAYTHFFLNVFLGDIDCYHMILFWFNGHIKIRIEPQLVPTQALQPVTRFIPRKAAQVGCKKSICYLCLTVNYGWNADMYFNLVSVCLNCSVQKWLMEILSLSETIIIGKSCNFTTPVMEVSATTLLAKGWLSTKKCAYFVNLSTTTMLVSFSCYLVSWNW